MLVARSADGSLVGIHAPSSSSSPGLVRCYDGRVSSGSLKFTLRLPTSPPTSEDADERKDDPLRKLVFASANSSKNGGSGGAPTHLIGMKSTSLLVWDLDRGVLSNTINIRDATTAGKKKKKRKSSVAGGNEILCDATAGNDGQLHALIFFPDADAGEGSSLGKCRVYQYDLGKEAALAKKVKVGSVPAPSEASGGDNAGPVFGMAVSDAALVVRMGRQLRVTDLASGSKLCKADIPGDASSDNTEGGSFAPIGIASDGRHVVVGCNHQAVVFSHKKGDDDKHVLQAVALLSTKDDDAPVGALDINLDEDILAVLASQPSVGTASLFSVSVAKSPSSPLVPQLPQATLQTDESEALSLVGAGFHPLAPDESIQLLFRQGKAKSGSASGSGTKLPMESLSYAGLEGTVTVGASLLEEAKGKEGKKRKSASTVALAPGDQGMEAAAATDLTAGKAKKKARAEGGEGAEEALGDDAFGDLGDLGDEEGEQGQSIAERLALLSSAMEDTDEEDEGEDDEEEEGEEGAKKPSKSWTKSATVSTLQDLLSQALSSNDTNQLHVALQVTDRRLVEGTVRALQVLDAQRAADPHEGDAAPSLLPTLMAHIVRRMARKHTLMMPLGVWVRAILAATARSAAGRAEGGAEAQERMAREGREMAAKLGPLRNLLDERVECFPQLLRLEGRLALLNQQL